MALTREQKWERYLEAAREIHACVDGLKAAGLAYNEATANRFAGIIAEWIFRCPEIHSGLISEEGMKQKTPTSDHYFGRKSSGVLVYKKILQGHSVERIAMIIASRSRVHYVSSQENTRLKQFDNKKLIKPKARILEEYSLAVSQMVPFKPRRKQKYVYIINEIEYNSAKEAAKANGCSIDVLNNRCLVDKRGNYPDWSRKDYELS